MRILVDPETTNALSWEQSLISLMSARPPGRRTIELNAYCFITLVSICPIFNKAHFFMDIAQ